MKPIIKLFDKTFTLIAIIDDYQGASFEHNYFSAGQFTITINYNIPNAKLFERGLFVQFGDNPYDFGEIISVNNTIGSDGKGSEFINVSGYDARYLFKRRVIKNLNNNDTWSMTAKGELCMRNLVADQCGTNAETKRQLPITNTIPLAADAIGSTYSVSESFSNLYDVLVTIATQSEIGWAVLFENGTLTLHVYKGSDLSSSVQFSTDFESLANGNYKDSSESFANSIYIGGKGTGSERDIYEGEDGTPEGIDRFEAYDNQSSMTTEDEYEAEALSMLSQYGQTVSMSGAGLAKCPYIFREQYNIGDIVKLSFSGKSANVQILSVTEVWQWNRYGITFNFGKPVNTINEQLNLILRKIQEASNKNKTCESVKWYDVATDTAQSASEVIFNTIGFTGAIPSGGRTFTLYRDDEGTGAKNYVIYTKNLSGSDNLILTTGVIGAENASINAGNNIIMVIVDTDGNVIMQSSTSEIPDDSVTTQKISDDAVTTPKIDDGAVTLPKVDDTVLLCEKYLYCDSYETDQDKIVICDGFVASSNTIIKVYMAKENRASNPILKIVDSNGNIIVSGFIKDPTGNSVKLYNVKKSIKNYDGSHYTYTGESKFKTWGSETTLELKYTGTDFKIIGNSILLNEYDVYEYYNGTTSTEPAKASYVVYANGLIEQWGITNSSPTLFPIVYANNCIVNGHQASTSDANAGFWRFPHDITPTQFLWTTGRGIMNWIAIGH